jgi:hypothetical protein
MGTTKPKKGAARIVFDDAVLANCRNGAAARGGLPAALTDGITARIHEGRPFWHFWGGQVTAASQPLTTALYMLRLNTLEGGCKSPRGVMQFMFKAAAGSPDAGIYATDGTLNKIPGGSQTQLYPDDLQSYPISQDTALDTSVPTGKTDPMTLGSDSIILTSGCLFEETVTAARPRRRREPRGMVSGGRHPGDEDRILCHRRAAHQPLRARLEQPRPMAGWSALDGSYCAFTESPQQSGIGATSRSETGAGRRPRSPGPGDTIVTANAGAGLRETVRVYVSVLAAMSGPDDQGTLAIANRATDGTMWPFTQIGSSGMISGTSPQWYPATGSAFDPATAPHFDSPTVLPFDHVLLGAKSSGAADIVNIYAWSMFVYHSVA